MEDRREQMAVIGAEPGDKAPPLTADAPRARPDLDLPLG
jgi:hypothetical protein